MQKKKQREDEKNWSSFQSISSLKCYNIDEYEDVNDRDDDGRNFGKVI